MGVIDCVDVADEGNVRDVTKGDILSGHGNDRSSLESDMRLELHVLSKS